MKRSARNTIRVGVVSVIAALLAAVGAVPAQAATNAYIACDNYWWPLDDYIYLAAIGTGYPANTQVIVWSQLFKNGSYITGTPWYRSTDGGGVWAIPEANINVGSTGTGGTYVHSIWVTDQTGEHYLGGGSGSCSLP